MSLTLALNTALSGLNINQRSLQVLSQNITNATTPGYSRQTLNQAAVYIAGNGAGVTEESITRKTDNMLQQTVRQKTSDAEMTSTMNNYLQQAQLLYGQPGASGSIDQTTQTFFNNMQSLSVSPESTSAQQIAVGSGAALAKQISGLSGSLASLRYQADQEIASSLANVNTALTDLYKLNSTLQRAYASGQSTAGLLDQRDKDLKTLSQYLNVSVTVNQDGTAGVYTGFGIPLVDGHEHAFQYKPASSVSTFTGNGGTLALEVVQLDTTGKQVGQPQALVEAGDGITPGKSQITSGILGGLLQIRDTVLPNAVAQLDSFAAGLRDQLNTLQNSGSSFPGLASMNGTRMVAATDSSEWTGQVRIAVLDTNGKPVGSVYSDESGVRPLTLDLGSLNGGQGTGKPTVQSIVNAINTAFGTPQPKAEIGLLNNVKLVSETTEIPNNPQRMNVDFRLDNISASNADFWLTGVTVTDSAGTTLPNAATYNTPQFALDPAAAYTTQMGSTDVIVNTVFPPNASGLADGATVYLGDPGQSINGLSSNSLTGFFKIKNVTSTGFTVTAVNPTGATSTGSATSLTPNTGYPKYTTAIAGENKRTETQGSVALDVSANPLAAYYDVTAQVAVTDASGTPQTGSVTYRIYNNTTGLLNREYAATAANGLAKIVDVAKNTNPYLTAKLVDANGKELPKGSDGSYGAGEGYLSLTASNGNTVAIDELDSREAATGWGFSHYFNLNDFFKSNQPTATGDTVRGSAFNLGLSKSLASNPAGITTGTTMRSLQPTGAGATPLYTYERVSGDNSIAQKFAALNDTEVTFQAAGGLVRQSTSLTNYASSVLGSAATTAKMVTDQDSSNQALLQGFQSQLDSITGVNMDEELSNTIIFQNSYAATARIITVVDKMMQDLIGVFQ